VDAGHQRTRAPVCLAPIEPELPPPPTHFFLLFTFARILTASSLGSVIAVWAGRRCEVTGSSGGSSQLRGTCQRLDKAKARRSTPRPEKQPRHFNSAT
ncbi:Uncharacterized protein DAT39_016917, partial [Clarias magur]